MRQASLSLLSVGIGLHNIETLRVRRHACALAKRKRLCVEPWRVLRQDVQGSCAVMHRAAVVRDCIVHAHTKYLLHICLPGQSTCLGLENREALLQLVIRFTALDSSRSSQKCFQFPQRSLISMVTAGAQQAVSAVQGRLSARRLLTGARNFVYCLRKGLGAALTRS